MLTHMTDRTYADSQHSTLCPVKHTYVIYSMPHVGSEIDDVRAHVKASTTRPPLVAAARDGDPSYVPCIYVQLQISISCAVASPATHSGYGRTRNT